MTIVLQSIYKSTHGGSPLPFDNANQEALERAVKSAPFYSFLAIVIVGPLMEEIAFRYGIIGSFKNKKLGVVVSVIIFGSMHMIASIGTGNMLQDI